MKHVSEASLICLGGDSTAVNTGWKGGVITCVEQMLGKRLIWVVVDVVYYLCWRDRK